MRSVVFVVFFILLFGCSSSKKESNKNNIVNEIDFHEIAEESTVKNEQTGKYETMPYPIGGIESIMSKIVYPNEALENKIEGVVQVKTWIDSLGNVADTKVIDGIGYGCDEAAIVAIKSTKFVPAKVDWKPVNVIVSIPISFQIK